MEDIHAAVDSLHVEGNPRIPTKRDLSPHCRYQNNIVNKKSVVKRILYFVMFTLLLSIPLVSFSFVSTVIRPDQTEISGSLSPDNTNTNNTLFMNELFRNETKEGGIANETNNQRSLPNNPTVHNGEVTPGVLQNTTENYTTDFYSDTLPLTDQNDYVSVTTYCSYNDSPVDNSTMLWSITETSLDTYHKEVIVSSESHPTNVTAFATIENRPNDTIHLFHVINGSKKELRFTAFDLDGDNLVDRIEWAVPHLSEQTYEIIIDVIKAEHLDLNKIFLSDIYDQVQTWDQHWSEPIYNGEYVRVTFEDVLGNTNDITIVARSSGTSRIEVYTKDSETLITTFEDITQERQYQVFLTNLSGRHATFDLRTIGDAVEYDYIVDPTGWISPTAAADPSNQWSSETKTYDDNTGSYAVHGGGNGWRGFLELSLSSAIYCDRVRVLSDFGYGYVDLVDIDIYNSTSWIDKYNGTISDCTWTELEFSGETNVTKARFRYHYISGSVQFYFYEFDFFQGKPHTLPNGTTLNATSIDETTVILNGNITDDGGEPCEFRFQYGSNTSYGINTTWGGSKAQNSTFSTMIHNLVLGNTYQFRMQIRNDMGTINGSNKNFTTAIPSLGWVTPTSHYDPNSHWDNEHNTYDDDYTDTYTQSLHQINDPDGLWSFYIYVNHSIIICDKVRFYARGPTGDATQVDQIDLDVKRGGVWVNVYEGTFSDRQWVQKSFMQGSVDQARIRFHINAANGGLYYQLYEFDFNKSRPVPMVISEGPTNRSWGNALRPQMNITVNNPDGVSMTINWSSNSSGSWQLFGTNSSVGNGTYHQINNNFTSNNTKYWWKVSVTDGTDSNTSWYYFSTPDFLTPSSNVVTLTPYWKKSAATITATATDTGWSGLKNVTLYYRFSADNSSWDGWADAGVDSASPWSWSFAFSNGTGYYQFYSIAADNATNTETATGSADTWCGYETTAPSSSVATIASYWKTSAPQTFTGTASDVGPSGLKNVTLRYRYRATNLSSWGGWVSSGQVDTDPWVAVSWNFSFSNGTGHYQFYSSAYDNATNSESAPGSADAACAYDNLAPISSLADGSISDSTVSTFEWNAAEGRHPAIIRLGVSEYYLVAAEGDLGGGGSTYDGWLFTIRVWSTNGTLQKSLIDSWEYDISDGYYPSVCLVNGSSDIYAITYEDAGSSARKIITTRAWSTNGSLQKTILDTLSLYRSTTTSYSKILNVNGNIYAITYVNNSDGDGRLATCYITSAGAIGNSVNDTLEFNSSDALNPQMCLADDNTIVIVYDGGTAGGNDGYLVTYNISSTGDITNTWADQWEFDTTMCTTPNIFKVWDDSKGSGANRFVIGYEDSNSDLYVKTCVINDTGMITKSWVDTQAIDTTNGDFCSFALVGDNSSATTRIMLVGFSGEGSDGYVSSFDVTNAGVINSEIDTLEFDAADCLSRPWLIKTSATFGWIVVYESTGNDGWGSTFTVMTNEVPYWKTASPFTIIGTGSDNGPSGLINVTLWYRYRVTNTSGWGGWVRWNSASNPDADPWIAISWGFTFPNGTGRYQFYSIGRDNVSNTESVPGNADVSCGYDNEGPVSSVNLLPSYWTSTSPLTINVTASDGGSGVKNVTLFYCFSTNNVSWGGWVNAGVDTTSPWSWSFAFLNGTGYYQFYSIARDNLTNMEVIPGSTDVFCGYEISPPSSSVDPIIPYWKKAGTTLTATASDTISGVKNVTLFYRFSTDNATWGGWTTAGVDIALPWNWSFSFSNGSGYYQFYSIANDNATNEESAPGSADRWCGYENQVPASSVTTISGYWKTSSPIVITGAGSDAGPSGLKNITLYYNFRATNASAWGGNTSFEVDTDPWVTCSWNFSFPSGPGHYQFYSIARDNATNTEVSPGGNGDTTCGFSTNAPISVINKITPYWTSATPLMIEATAEDVGPSGLKNVTLYYYNSSDNNTWNGPWRYGVDSDPWVNCSWSFLFSNQTGYYRFYSQAADNSSNVEDAPPINDTACGFDSQSPICSISYNQTDSSFKTSDSLKIYANFTEPYSGMNESSVLITISTLGNGSLPNTSMNMINNSHWYYNWTIPTGSDEDGLCTVRIYATDNVANNLLPYPTIDASKLIDNTPPVISNVSIDNVSSSSARISWITSENATSHVEYGPTHSFGSWLHYSAYVIIHPCTLSGLSSDTTYYYRVISFDSAGNQATSLSSTFTTLKETIISRHVVQISENIPPSSPIIDGPTTGHISQSYTFTVSSLDANNDSVDYTINWGDGIRESSGLMRPGRPFRINHSWLYAGKYTITVTASDNKTSASSEKTIWIDAVVVGDIGYLVDADSDGIFDAFHSNVTGRETATEKKQGIYLLDVDGDYQWEYEFNVTTGIVSLISQQPAVPEKPSFLLLWLGGLIFAIAIGIVILLYRRRPPKDKMKQEDGYRESPLNVLREEKR